MIPHNQSTPVGRPGRVGRGLGFQCVVDHVNAIYHRMGRAFITRKSIPGKYIARRGKGLGAVASSISPQELTSGTAIPAAVFRQFVSDKTLPTQRIFIPESRAEPDYGGVVAPDGRAIAYDAKSTRRERLDFDNIHPHQMDFLEAMAACGAIAGFLVEFALHRTVFFVPVQLVTMVSAMRGRRSLQYQLCASQLVPVPAGQNGIIWDYLAAIEEQEKRYGRDCRHFPPSSLIGDPKTVVRRASPDLPD